MSTERLTTSDLAHAATPPPAPERPDRDAPAHEDPARGPAAAPAPTVDDSTPLFASNAADDLRRRWDEIQTGFVDEPRQAVEHADRLVAEAMKRLAETFASARENLEGRWDRGDQVSTEDLRQVLRQYRSFFHRLLAV